MPVLPYREHMPANQHSPSIEDYVKAIYKVSERDEGPVTTTALAAELGVSASSASGMLRKLAERDLVLHTRYGGAELTDAGRRLALDIVRRHRLIESYLAHELGYSWDEVHDEAEVLEHVVSPTLLARMAAKLGEPTSDPHGDPIPAADGTLSSPQATALAELAPGTTGTIARVRDDDPDLLRYLSTQRIGLGDPIEVVERQPFGGPLLVRVGAPPHDAVHAFGPGVAEAVSILLVPSGQGQREHAE